MTPPFRAFCGTCVFFLATAAVAADSPRSETNWPVYAHGVNRFSRIQRPSPAHPAWRGGTWDSTTGHGDQTSLRLDGGQAGKDRCQVELGGPGFAPPLPAGLYTLVAWVKTKDPHTAAAIGVQRLPSPQPPTWLRIARGSGDAWQKVQLQLYLPGGAPIRLILAADQGTAWFDDVELQYPRSEARVAQVERVFFYEAEDLGLTPGTGEIVDDRQATGGRAIRTAAGVRGAVSGPKSTVEPIGNYVAWFRASLERPTGAEVLELEVREESTDVAARRTVRGSEFRTPGVYQYFSLPFHRRGTGPLQYNVRWPCGAVCRIDHVAAAVENELWADDFAPGAVVDQAQWLEGGYTAAASVGQTFVAGGDTLQRVDLVVKNRTDTQPGMFRLWRWEGSYRATVQAAPLFEDQLDLSGADTPQVRHWLPQIAVEPGRTYYMEIAKSGHEAAAITVAADLYPGGMAFINGQPQADRDLAFVTYTRGPAGQSPPAAAATPTLSLGARLPPLPVSKTDYSREDYRALLWQHIQSHQAAWAHEEGKYGHEQARFLAFAYRVTGDEVWARRAIDRLLAAAAWRAVHLDEEVGFPWCAAACSAYQMIERSPSLEPADRQTIQGLLLDSAARHWPIRELGAMNRSMGSALGYLLMAQIFPSHALAPQWKSYAQAVWDDWFALADTDENSLHYHAVWWDYVLRYAEAAHITAMDQRPEVRRLIERYRDQLSPLGAMPPYGDCYGWGFEWGGYVMLFERAATVYRDGTFKQAAHAVFDHLVRRIKNVQPYQANYEDLGHLMSAYLWADDSVRPQPIPGGSKLQTRHALRLLPAAQRNPQRRWFYLEPGEVPDKLMLRASGDGLWAAFDLMPTAGHTHSSAVGLVALSDRDTALITDTCYEDRDAADHNVLYLKRLRGGRVVNAPPTQSTVRHFAERPDLTYCETEIGDYGGWGTTMRRAIFWAKDRFLWIHDQAQFSQTMTASVGPLWFAGEVAARGANWFDVTWSEPRGFFWTWRNGDRRLLVYFVPRAGTRIDGQYEAWKTQRAFHQWSPPWCLYQKQAGLAAAPGQCVEFDTVLIPHGPADDPARLAAAITAGTDASGRWVRLAAGAQRVVARVRDGKPEVRAEP